MEMASAKAPRRAFNAKLKVVITISLRAVSRVALLRALNSRAAISPEMALRIDSWSGMARGGEARLWLAEQSVYDVWQVKQRFKAVPMHAQAATLAVQRL